MTKRKQAAVYTFDQFFTKTDVAQMCVDQLDVHSFDSCIEPSAGEGAFYNLLPDDTRKGVEIDPRLATDKMHCGSWFDWSCEKGNHLVIGNPPFGTQNKDAIRFFNHAAKFAECIAFIIPRTWKRPSVQNQLSLDFTLWSSTDVDNAFEGEKVTTVKCCFQIWRRSDKPRKKVVQKVTHADWEFLKYTGSGVDLIPPATADFVMLAYGSNPGQIDDNIHRWRPKSVHFIRANNDVDTLKTRFKGLDYSMADDSARQSSLGKGALIQLYGDKYGL